MNGLLKQRKTGDNGIVLAVREGCLCIAEENWLSWSTFGKFVGYRDEDESVVILSFFLYLSVCLLGKPERNTLLLCKECMYC